MKKKLTAILLLFSILLCSCQMEEVIPEQGDTCSIYFEHKELFQNSVEALLKIDYDCLISRTDYYSPEGSENFTGLYIQNMSDSSFSEFTESSVQTLFDETNVKLVDFLRVEDLSICAFDMCVPGRNFDFGIYYVSEDAPIYFGDPSIPLIQKGNGFTYEKAASYGTKFTYYTEKIADQFYYYEII